MEWGEVAFQIAVVIAITTWIKKLVGYDVNGKSKLGHYCMLISMGVAFGIVFLAIADSFVALDYVKQSIIVGLSASGTVDVAKLVGSK